jgi:hypothetical protein
VIDVFKHVHGGHSSTIKVQSAMSSTYEDKHHYGHHAISKVQLAIEPVYGDEIHGGHCAVSKVRIAMEPLYGDECHQGHHVISKVRQALKLEDQGHGGHHNASKVKFDMDHEGHHSVSKVQRAVECVYGDESHQGHHAISKVRPADVDEPSKPIHQSQSFPSANSTAVNPYLLDYDHHGHCRQSKVRPILDHVSMSAAQPDYFPNDAHRGHVWVEKVQSFHDTNSRPLTCGTDLHSMPRLVALLPSTPVESEDCSQNSKVASYWEFLPRFKEMTTEVSIASQDSRTPDHDELSSLDIMPEIESEQRSKSLSHIRSEVRRQHGVSLKSNDSMGITSFKSTFQIEPSNSKPTYSISMDHQNSHNDNHIPNNASRSMTASMLHERLRDLEHVQGNLQKSATNSLPASDRAPHENMPQQSKHRLLPQGLDPKRTAQWLRKLLKHREPHTTRFTELPEKIDPQHEEHEVYPTASDSAFATRVTTFSDVNAADAGEMNEAMNRLEQLLSEALNLANEAADRNEERDIDEDHSYRRRNETSGDS